MRLTHNIRCHIAEQVASRMPYTNYREKVEKIVVDLATAELPPEARKLWKDNNLRGYVAVSRFYSDYRVLSSVVIPGPLTTELNGKIREAIDPYVSEMAAQRDAQDEVRRKTMELLKGFNTTQQLLKAIPEFAPFLPEEPSKKTANLPAEIVSNFFSELRSLGWGKSETNQTKEESK